MTRRARVYTYEEKQALASAAMTAIQAAQRGGVSFLFDPAFTDNMFEAGEAQEDDNLTPESGEFFVYLHEKGVTRAMPSCRPQLASAS